MNHEDKTFTNEQVPLDDNVYTRCTFNACTFVYRGGDWSMVDCKIRTVGGLLFGGSAGATMQLLKSFFALPTARELILATLDPANAPPGMREISVPNDLVPTTAENS